MQLANFPIFSSAVAVRRFIEAKRDFRKMFSAE
jgi:hypothetical protein